MLQACWHFFAGLSFIWKSQILYEFIVLINFDQFIKLIDKHLMSFRWLRKWVRRTSKPIPEPVAQLWKRRLSLAYGILAWNAIAVVAYAAYNGKRDWAAYHGLEAEPGSPGKFTKSYHSLFL